VQTVFCSRPRQLLKSTESPDSVPGFLPQHAAYAVESPRLDSLISKTPCSYHVETTESCCTHIRWTRFAARGTCCHGAGCSRGGHHFFTGFCVEGHTHALRKKDRQRPKRNNALWSAEQLRIKLHIVDIIDEYKDVVINPKHGYGSNLNPCLDCKIFMVNKAREWIDANGFDFIITGEVVGQRPMSQRKDTLPVVARDSGAGERLVRPLCARNLPPTLPEIEGWLDRDRLYGFNGRSRKPQMALAKQFGFEDYAQPAGGCCFLTDKQYAVKLADLWNTRGKRDYDFDDIMLLKVGRHLRPGKNFKLIVGREEGENRYLEGYRKRFINIIPTSHTAPWP